MIEEAYVSFETAKLLKEKGFNERLLTFYITDEAKKEGCFQLMAFTDDKIDNNHSDHCYLAPTLQMAMKWLREVHNIQIELNWDKGNQLYSFNIWKPGRYQPEISSLDLWRIYKDDNYLGEWKYEEACEAALLYSLENLVVPKENNE